MSDNNRIDKLFPMPGTPGGLPIIGSQEEQPSIMSINVILMPKLKDKLMSWSEKTGLTPGEIGATIMRLGLIALSFQIDQDNEQIKDPYEFIPKQ
jgi:hypothetical protein